MGGTRCWRRSTIPSATCRKIWGTHEALAGLDIPSTIPVTFANAADLGRLVPGDAPHQGLVAEVDPLEEMWLADLLRPGRGRQSPAARARPRGDPIRTMSARSCARQRRSTRSASSLRPACPVRDGHARPLGSRHAGSRALVPRGNLARALEENRRGGLLAHRPDRPCPGHACPGDGRSAQDRPGARRRGRRHAPEHRGALRRACDSLPISDKVESLSVSNAAAIALYAVTTRD